MGKDKNCNSKSDNATSSNDNNVASSISRTSDGFGGESAGFIKAGESYCLTHNGTFSPKYFQSGWGEGIRGQKKI